MADFASNADKVTNPPSDAAMIDASTKRVLVTGATGFVAGHIVQQLLLRGYHVRGSVRDLRQPERFAFLSRVPNAASNLSLVELDLRLPDNDPKWRAAFDGVDYVIHVAAPYDLRATNISSDIVEPIVQGTRSIMKHCQATPGLQRVILTSCMSAICDEFVPDKLYTEVDWNEKATIERNPYAYAKTLAENEAWAFVNNNKCHFDLVSILPGLILGPHLDGKVSMSHRFILGFLDGTAIRVPNLTYAIVDVRDVASAHIIALEKREANGRYFCGTTPVPLVRIMQIIHENFADLNVPSKRAPDAVLSMMSGRIPKPLRDVLMLSVSRPPHISGRRGKKLGMYFRSSVETIVDTCRYFIESNNIQLGAGGGACSVL